jgi:hypothetical protein
MKSEESEKSSDVIYGIGFSVLTDYTSGKLELFEVAAYPIRRQEIA